MSKWKLINGTTVEQTSTALLLTDGLGGGTVALSQEAWNQLAGPGEFGMIIVGPIWEPAPADDPPEELPQ